MGRRRLTQSELFYKTPTVGLNTYLELSQDLLVPLVHQQEKAKTLYSVHKKYVQFKEQLEIGKPKMKMNKKKKNNAICPES